MVFGEIIEPSTRAFVYEEDDNLSVENFVWDMTCTIPTTINSLLLAETTFINKIIENCLLRTNSPVAATKCKTIRIYKYALQKYVILCNLGPAQSIGQVTEEILPWIQASKQCYALLTQPTATYQNKSLQERPACLLRTLTTANGEGEELCPRLERPNLVTGVGANCLSYCIFADQKCSLFVGYIDHAPIDSMNSQPFVDLLGHLGFDSVGKTYKLVNKLPENNLYT